MDGESDRCAAELSDARVDVLGYACLVAIMATGLGYHRQSEARLRGRTQENGADIPAVTSAGALIDGLKVLHDVFIWPNNQAAKPVKHKKVKVAKKKK